MSAHRPVTEILFCLNTKQWENQSNSQFQEDTLSVYYFLLARRKRGQNENRGLLKESEPKMRVVVERRRRKRNGCGQKLLFNELENGLSVQNQRLSFV